MANTYNTKNYFAHGGEQLVIGGKLTFLDGAEVENSPGSASGNAASGTAPYVADSEATTVANLKNDFNALLAALREDFNRLLAALREAGMMAPASEGADG